MLLLVVSFAFAATAVLAQTGATTGNISGQVTDANGAAIPGATVKVTGAQADRSVTTNDLGLYEVKDLIPGTYRVRIEQKGFKAKEVSEVAVYVGRTAKTNVGLEAGNIAETVTVTAGVAIDQASTAVSSNISDQLFNNIPVQRGVTSLFYLAPGTTDSLGGGAMNPSISGGSALDNLYVADGVNITDSAFGGLGTFSRSYGSLGTGILTSFVKEVQVKPPASSRNTDSQKVEFLTSSPNRAAMSSTALFTPMPDRGPLKVHVSSATTSALTRPVNSCMWRIMTPAEIWAGRL